MVSARPVVFIAGPTASGKTALAIELAQHYPVDLINVDAAQVYRGMDIGTAKLSIEEQRQYPHQLIDIRDPADTYNAVQFRNDALAAIKAAHDNQRIPVLVGGTLFYFMALERGISELPSGNAELRDQITERGNRLGWQHLHRELADIDPKLGLKIKSADAQRICRALEIHALTGEAPSAIMQRHQPEPMPYPAIKFALFLPDRAELHARIEERFQQMLSHGLIDEVQGLRQRNDLNAGSPSMRAVGYRQTWAYLDGDIDKDQLLASGVAATRQLAKRQLTWLRQQSNWVWLMANPPPNINWIRPFLSPYEN